MKTMKRMIITMMLASVAAVAFAGGDPEFVAFPEGYKESDTNYTTVNRANGKQVGVLYANEAAIRSIKYGDQLIPGSRITMEIYKKKMDADGNAIEGADGIFEKGDLAAIAVMEKSIVWSNTFSADHRSEEWGFALYDPKGNIKENKLECATCHIPLTDNEDNLFTHAQLKATGK
jgi:hypothetical protein